MPDDKQAPPRMNQTERNALVKVVRSRFEVMRKHAKQRRDELRDAIFERIVAENESKIEAARRDMGEIEARARKLEDDAEAVIKKHQRKGVKLGTAKMISAYTDHGYKETERTVSTSGYLLTGFNIPNAWYIADIANQVEREFRRLEREYGLGEVAMARREQELTEEIILGGVNPEASQDFLERVPTLNALPTVEDAVKRLNA